MLLHHIQFTVKRGQQTAYSGQQSHGYYWCYIWLKSYHQSQLLAWKGHRKDTKLQPEVKGNARRQDLATEAVKIPNPEMQTPTVQIIVVLVETDKEKNHR
ncbi:uncharacterized protein LOC110473922 isoform X2 [Lonchura striata]